MRYPKTLVTSVLLLASTTTSGLAQVQTLGGTEDRKLTRIFYYTRSDAGFQPKGQLSIDYGVPTWKKLYDDKEAFDKLTRGHRWRFGGGMWTRLDTNLDLELGGKTIPAGSYYLILERTKDDKLNLVLLDPKDVRKKKMDGFQADQIEGGTVIEMQWTRDNDSVEQLKIALTAEEKKPEKVKLSVAWGPHRLALDLVAKV